MCPAIPRVYNVARAAAAAAYAWRGLAAYEFPDAPLAIATISNVTHCPSGTCITVKNRIVKLWNTSQNYYVSNDEAVHIKGVTEKWCYSLDPDNGMCSVDAAHLFIR
jgi:hypothetical protein